MGGGSVMGMNYMMQCKAQECIHPFTSTNRIATGVCMRTLIIYADADAHPRAPLVLHICTQSYTHTCVSTRTSTSHHPRLR